MKFIYKFYYYTLFIVINFSISYGQVAIGTTSPKGMLDLQNNTTMGLIYPRVALTATNVATPVLNPNGGNLVEGTVVYNTSYTTNGANDVYPGIYAWDGTQWTTQFIKEDAVIFEQSPLDLRVVNSNSYVDVPGLGNGSTFTAKYTGTYRIIANFNFGAGKINTPSSGNTSMATQEGYFRFSFDGTPYLIYTHAYSVYNVGLTTYFEQFRHDSSLILYETLTAGQTYSYRLEVDLFVSSDFENSGNSGDGRSHVGIGLPCTVEFTFLEGN
jgi:hypothetical protein